MKEKIFNLNNEMNASCVDDKIEDSIAAFWVSVRDSSIASRSNGRFKCEARDFLKKVDKETINKLEDLLFAYESEPIAIFLNECAAFAVPSFMRAGGLYMIVIPNVSVKAVAFAIDNGMLGDIKVIGEPAGYKYVSGAMRKDARMLSVWLSELRDGYGIIELDGGVPLGELMRKRIQMIAEHIGISARAVTVGEIAEDERLDLALFISFVTVMLLLAKARSCDGSVAVNIGEDSHGAYVRMAFEYDGRTPRYDVEAEILHGIADKKRILFEVIEDEQIFSVRFSPIIEDWSLLEVKLPDDEELEFELT